MALHILGVEIKTGNFIKSRKQGCHKFDATRSAETHPAPAPQRLLPSGTHERTAMQAVPPRIARLRDTLASMGTPAPEQSRTYVFGTTFRTCAVCLEEYRVGDTLRVLEPCGHCFHARCVDTWTSRRPVCPVCNAPTCAPQPARAAALPEAVPVPSDAVTVPRVQLIDLSVHDSWLEWLAKLVNRRGVPEDNPPLSLATVPL